MGSVRRGLILSSAERYGVLLLGFVATMVTARILTPSDFGIAVVGLAIYGITDIFRDFGGGTYLVQVDKITPERVQTVFTLTTITALPLFAIQFFLAGDIAKFYGAPGLESYLRVSGVCLLLSSFSGPVYSLLRRDLAFGKITILSLSTSVLNFAATIILALSGFSFMSFAWAQFISTVVYLGLCVWWGPKFPIYRISFEDWRRVAGYGVFDCAKNILTHLGESAPFLAFGKTLGMESLGVYQRALSVSRLPDRTVLAGFAPVLQPAFSKKARDGHDLKDGFFFGIEHVTVLLWPALIMIILLVHPLVAILLGSQWTATIPLIQMIAASFLIWFPLNLPGPILVAANAVRDTAILALITVPVTVAIQIVASFHSLEAVAASFFVTNAFCVLVSVLMVRRRVPFAWHELGAALKKSALVTLGAVVGPVLIVSLVGGVEHVSIAAAVVAGVTAAIGWYLALAATQHPMHAEIKRALEYVARARRPVAES
jgi:O-antigen/teichoic acid export membrane protein